MQFYPEFDARVYAFEVVMGQPSVFWKRQVTESIGGFDERLRYSGDFEYWLRASGGGFRYQRLDDALALEVQHEHTLSALYPERVRGEIASVRNDLDSIRPRSFARLRRYQRAMQWRLFVLDFSINSWRREPARWRNVILLLRAAEVRVRLRDALML